MRKLGKVYEGKAKILYETDEPELIIQHFKDDATAFDGKKRGKIFGKGSANAQISSILFRLLEEEGIKTHFPSDMQDKKILSENEILAYRLKMIPLEIIVRNVAAGSLAKRLGYEEGRILKKPIVEFYYKSDELGDPLLNADHICELGLVDSKLLRRMKETSLKVNEILKDFLAERGLELVDFKLEFGLKDDELILADEISPDTCRLWDKRTGEILDKDRFRRDLGGVERAYQEVLRRIKG
ncbi:MAG: phosphoribosylaminoimidazolesuccinocarboxamide synthase [Actinomycetota bacterium]